MYNNPVPNNKKIVVRKKNDGNAVIQSESAENQAIVLSTRATVSNVKKKRIKDCHG